MNSTESHFWKFYPIVLGLLLIFVLVAVAVYTSPLSREPQAVTSPTRTPLPTETLPPPTSTPTLTPEPVILTGCSVYGVRIRDIPSTNTEILGGIPPGGCVTILGRTEDAQWVWVQMKDIKGWVSVEFLTIQGDIQPLPVMPANAK